MVKNIVLLVLLSFGWEAYALVSANDTNPASTHQVTVVYRYNDLDNSVAIATPDQPLKTAEEIQQFALHANFTPIVRNSDESANLSTPLNNNKVDPARRWHHRRYYGWGYYYPYYGPYYYGYPYYRYPYYGYCFGVSVLSFCGY